MDEITSFTISCKISFIILSIFSEWLAALIGGPVECAIYKPMGSLELAETAAIRLKDRHAILLANHGVLAVGHDIDSAFANSVVVEEGAKIAFYARQIGVMRLIPEEECRSLRKISLEKYGQKNGIL